MLHSSPVAELRHFGLGQAITRVSSRCPAGPGVHHRKQDPMMVDITKALLLTPSKGPT